MAIKINDDNNEETECDHFYFFLVNIGRASCESELEVFKSIIHL